MGRLVGACCAILLVTGVPVTATAAMPSRGTSPALSQQQTKAIRNLVVKSLAALRVPGATVAIGLDDKVIWSEGFGLADVENDIRATPQTAYRTASIGKSITATAAMKLAEMGKLDLDEQIQTYCPRFRAKPWPITTRDLISHTSGIRHYGGKNEQDELFNVKHYDRASDALELFENDPLKQRPGDDFMYTTWGYVTLGCVIEGASGEEFRALAQRLIFAPSGMTHTRDDDPRALIPNRARGYIIDDGKLVNSRWVDMSSKLAAGGWITTAPDLVRFMNSWMAGRLVSASTMATMTTPYRLPRGKGTNDNFGMGWFLDKYHGSDAALYGGGTPQVSGFVFFVPDRRLSVAVLLNLEDVPSAKRADLAEAIGDIVLREAKPNRGFFNSK